MEAASASPRVGVVEAAGALAPLPALAVAAKPSSAVLRAISRPERRELEAAMNGAGEGLRVGRLRGVFTRM
ncbi:hypothetical protein AAF143_09485 [Cyanobium sp. ATX-6F1]